MSLVKILAFTDLKSTLLCLSVINTVNAASSENLWQKAELVNSPQGDYIKLAGRLQADAAWFDPKQGEYNDWSWRRVRFGFKGQFQQFTGALAADLNLDNSIADWYNRLTDANISYKVNPNLTLILLKHSAGFTLDGRTSSKKLLTPQRNNVTNNIWFTNEYFTGISAKGSVSSSLSYHAGIFSSDKSDEISVSEASYFSLLSLNKTLKKSAWFHGGNINIGYVYNDVHLDGGTANLSSIYNISGHVNFNHWQLAHDFSYARGDLGQSDMWGIVLMPSFQHTELVQWVLRYTYLTSEDNNGLKLGKYENEIVTNKGDEYQEFYAGVNWLFYQHKLKLQLGLQYAAMQDQANDGGEYQGWGVTLALRSYW